MKTFDFNDEILEFDSVIEKSKKKNRTHFAEIIDIEPILL